MHCDGFRYRNGRSLPSDGRAAGDGARVRPVAAHHLRRVRPTLAQTLLHQRRRAEDPLRRRPAHPIHQQHAPQQGT